jgi:hypothetical protein
MNAGWNFPSPDEGWVRGYEGELTDFVDCFREGRTPVSDLVLAEDTTRVIYSAYARAVMHAKSVNQETRLFRGG